MKFKLKNRVRIIQTPYDLEELPCPELAVGQIGTIVEIDEGVYFFLKMDNGYSENRRSRWPFVKKELQLIEEELK